MVTRYLYLIGRGTKVEGTVCSKVIVQYGTRFINFFLIKRRDFSSKLLELPFYDVALWESTFVIVTES